MSNKYDTKLNEAAMQAYRADHQTYAFDVNDHSKPVYSIDTPPPTVSGKLHIWHIASYTQAEVVARYKRMTGYNVFYPAGYDDNGIPTEQLVEKDTGIDMKQTARQDFIEICKKVNGQYRELYKSLWQSLGFSTDWNRTYYTSSAEVQAISQGQFIKLLQQGKIVKKEFPALRCTKNQTTIAVAETEEEEQDQFFNDIKFTIEGGGEIIIATTRPELMPACVALFVHPEDPKYTHLIGKTIITPFGTKVPLMADEKVKMDKGTGAVMCCSYGDETDTYWINTYKLTPKVIVSRYGKIENSGVSELDGLKIKEAREAIIPLLEAKGVVVKRTPIRQGIMMSERWKVPVEIIPIDQWFVNILDIREQIKDANNKMNWHPEHMKKRSDNWIDGLSRDWNISRNRKFGIPIPVWYSKKTGEMILPTAEELPVDPTSQLPKNLPAWHTADDVFGDELVLDTWFTSGVSPIINEKLLQASWWKGSLRPMSLRPQAHDIIRTWLLYTTIHSFYDMGVAPFADVMISGHVLAGKGEKISKSKGNAKVEPVALVDQFGADAVRYWASSWQLGKDIVFDELELKNGQKLVTKLWNAFQFVKMQLGDDQLWTINYESLYPTDQRILSRMFEVVEKMRKHLDHYEFGLAKIVFEEFFWTEFCDNYLEMVKVRLYKPELFENGEEKKKSAQYALYHVFSIIIRLLAPYLPHVTEAIYLDYFKKFEGHSSLHQQEYPLSSSFVYGVSVVPVFELVSQVRGYKTSNQLSLGADVQKLIISWPKEYLDTIKLFEDDVRGVTKAGSIEYREGKEALDIIK